MSNRTECLLPSAMMDLDDPVEGANFAAVKNVSDGGLKLAMRESPPPGHRLSLLIYPRLHMTLDLTVLPAWVHEKPDHNGYEVGVRYIRISSETKQTLNSLRTLR